jgi:hypothetical protein
MDGAATMTATAPTQTLTCALINIAAQGLRTHCSDPTLSELWISEHQPDRAEAAQLCIGCPIIIECGEAADERGERYVWGGIDRGTIR